MQTTFEKETYNGLKDNILCCRWKSESHDLLHFTGGWRGIGLLDVAVRELPMQMEHFIRQR